MIVVHRGGKRQPKLPVNRLGGYRSADKSVKIAGDGIYHDII